MPTLKESRTCIRPLTEVLDDLGTNLAQCSDEYADEKKLIREAMEAAQEISKYANESQHGDTIVRIVLREMIGKGWVHMPE